MAKPLVKAHSIDFGKVDTSSWTVKGQQVRRSWNGKRCKRWACLAVMYANRGVPYEQVLPEIVKACELRSLDEARSYYRYLAAEGYAPGNCPSGKGGSGPADPEQARPHAASRGGADTVRTSEKAKVEAPERQRDEKELGIAVLQTARLFKNGGSQAVRLPAEFRFEDVDEVRIRRDPLTGDVLLSSRPRTASELLALRDRLGPFEPDDLEVLRERDHKQTRVLFGEDASC